MRTRLYVVLAALPLVAAPGIVRAQAPQPRPAPPPSVEEDPLALAQDALERLMRAFGSMLDALPQYGAPRLNERGDIIVPRLNPKPKNRKRTAPDQPSGAVPVYHAAFSSPRST